jgi:TRAP-type C4-dicarboxylate transport system permease large subunit
VASSASGGKAGKGALIGAGVNVIGGALFDAMTGEKVATVDQVNSMPSQGAFQEGYNQGFNQGYQQGYNTGFTKGYEASSSKK